MVAHDVDRVGEADRQRRFGKPARPEYRHHECNEPAGGVANDEPAAELPRKNQHAVARMSRALARQYGNGQRINRDRRSIVEKALALNQGRQPARCTDVAKNSNHRGRISGRDNCAENDTSEDTDRGDRPQRETDDHGADDNADHREQQDWRHFVAQLSHIDV